MNLISFNLFRTLGLPDVTHLKPDEVQQSPHRFADQIKDADWVLFPEYWQLNGIVYGLGGRVFPSEATYRIGHNKIEMTRACQLIAPNNMPATWIAANTPDQAEHLWSELTLPFVAKLPKASQGEGVWLIENRGDWKRYLARTEVLYLQEYLPIDKDLRIVIVGEEVIAAYWRLQSDRSFHTNVSRGGAISHQDIPQSAIDLATSLAKSLHINHAGFDIAMVHNHPYLLEFNRLFGNQGIVGGGQTITDAMLRYINQYSAGKPDDPNRPGGLPLAV